MESERWRRIEELFHAALALEPESQRTFLDDACGPDSELRREVESLLAEDNNAAGFLESQGPETETETRNAVSAMLGRQFGPYEILTPLGAGGMGEVYRASDRKLDRDVALKFLPRAFASDPEWLARFRREARALASLNHPNIATIHSLEEFDEATCLVLELVEGETLHGPLPIEKSLEYARQVADAIEAAHETGIIHRDLKPANIKVTPQGRVKVLDFGLAKPVWRGNGGQDLRGRMPAGDAESQAGQIVGTPPYLSPEQAQGKDVDQRTDIWAFGCVLYELLTGKRAFFGETQSDTIAAVLEREPDWSALPAKTPAHIRRLLRRCLEKDAARRPAGMRSVREEIGKVQRGLSRRWQLAGAVLIFAGIAWRLVPVLTDNSFSPSKEVPLTSLPGRENYGSLSPDGESVAFMWTREINGESPLRVDPGVRVFVAPVKGGLPRRLSRVDLGAESAPAWSPAGDRVAIFGGNLADSTDVSIYLVSTVNGSARKIAVAPTANRATLSWSPDGRLLAFSQLESGRVVHAIHTISVADGAIRKLTTPPTSTLGDADPAFSPDGRWISFLRLESALVGDLYLIPAGGGEPRRLTDLASNIAGNAWMPDSNEIIFAAATADVFTLRRIRTDRNRILSSYRPVANIGSYGMYPTVVRPRGRPTELAFARTTTSTNIWRTDNPVPNQKLELRRIAASTRIDYDPSFSPDGSSIAFASNRSGYFEIWVCGNDGENARQLTSFAGPDVGSPRWSPDSRHIAFDAQPGNNPDIYVVEAGGGPVQRITTARSDDARPSWSADGRWIYFRSDRGGTRQIWKTPYAGRAETVERAQQVTTRDAHEAFESPDGAWLYFVRDPRTGSARESGSGMGGPDLWRIRTRGGAEEKLLDGVRSGAWGVAETGIYFVEQSAAAGSVSRKLVHVGESRPAERVVLATVERQMEDDSSAFAVSRDGRSFLLVFQHRDSDLFLVNDFR